MPDLKAIEDLLLKYDIKISSASYKAIEARKRYIPIKKNISEQTILKIKKDIKEERDKIKKLKRKLQKDIRTYKKDPEKKAQCLSELEKIKEDKFNCIGIEGSYKRVKKKKKLAAHVIGKVNSENVGTYGIENTCNDQLNGENIKRQKMVINRYKNILLDSPFEKDIDLSNDVVLTNC